MGSLWESMVDERSPRTWRFSSFTHHWKNRHNEQKNKPTGQELPADFEVLLFQSRGRRRPDEQDDPGHNKQVVRRQASCPGDRREEDDKQHRSETVSLLSRRVFPQARILRQGQSPGLVQPVQFHLEPPWEHARNGERNSSQAYGYPSFDEISRGYAEKVSLK